MDKYLELCKKARKYGIDTEIAISNLEDLAEVDKYVCKENLVIPFEDDDGSITDKFGVAKKGSIWKVSDEIGESDVRLYLVSGESDFSWIDICNETLNASFIRI